MQKIPIRDKIGKRTKEQDVLKLIHIDISGPIMLITMRRYCYVITFIDDYLRFGWMELLIEKCESLNVFKMFKNNLELKF